VALLLGSGLGRDVAVRVACMSVQYGRGLSLGCTLATAISYNTNEHIGWAILHGLFGWLYVIYCLIGFGR
jgi:hypothetical protein